MVDTLTIPTGSSITEPMNLLDVLVNQVNLRPGKEAVVFQGERLSYDHLLRRATAIATQLSQHGVKKGDRVAVFYPNHPDYIASFFAIAGLGATIVPVNPQLRSEEIAHILSDSGSQTLIVYADGLTEAIKSQQLAPSIRTMFAGKGTAQSLDVPGNFVIKPLTDEQKPGRLFPRNNIDRDNDLALLVYTSGTTGKPKGAMLTHANVLSVFPRRLDMLDISDKDRTLAVLPMCHIYGITVLMIGTLSTGGTLVVLPRFEAAEALKMIEQERVTVIPAVPAMHRFMVLAAKNNTYELSSVRLCLSGGSPLPVDLIAELELVTGATCIEGYALTETACAATLNPLHGVRKAGSVGVPLEGIRIRVVDDSGQPLLAGPHNIGEVQISGPNIMKGYYRQPTATNEVVTADGWFCSGDLGFIDEDGYLFIVGRKKEMIIRGGMNIYPREIEDVLCRIPGIVEAAVIGVPDQYMGERVKAVLVCNGHPPGEEEIKDFCGRHLADYKVPRLIEFRDTLPRNSTGKILKRLLS